MGAFAVGTPHGQLTINSVDLMGPAWKVLNLGAVMSVAVRGESVTIPTTAGRRSRQRFVDETTIGLEMLVTGDADKDGVEATTHDDRMAQLYDNLEALEAVSLPPETETGHSASLTLPNGTIRTADVFVVDWAVSPEPSFYVARVAFDLVIPSGRFS